VQRNLDNDNQSLRGFLRLVETEYPDELLRVREPIDLRFDATALVFELDHAGKSPVVVCENVRGSGMPLVTNVAGNRKLLAACLGVEPADLPSAFRERCQKYIPCEVVDRGAWDDVVLEGDDVDLAKLPIPLQFKVDAAPYITAGQIVARDPVTGVDTTGFHRLMLKGKNRLGVSLHSRRRLYEFHRRAEERGQSLPAVITLGTHPLHYMGSMVYAYPPHVRKFEIIGGLFGEPYRVARCGVVASEVGRVMPGIRSPSRMADAGRPSSGTLSTRRGWPIRPGSGVQVESRPDPSSFPTAPPSSACGASTGVVSSTP